MQVFIYLFFFKFDHPIHIATFRKPYSGNLIPNHSFLYSLSLHFSYQFFLLYNSYIYYATCLITLHQSSSVAIMVLKIGTVTEPAK